MSTDNPFASRNEMIKVILDIYDELGAGKRSAYEIGFELGRQKGKDFRRLVQGARTLVSSYISDLLVEVYHPLILEDNELYPELRKRYFDQFLAGLFKATA